LCLTFLNDYISLILNSYQLQGDNYDA